ncbi:MAG: hypothetical protein COA65_08790 [Rhodospirillaceae bacterium]|nr:MAG: hypothetical protein COA65_08790 [Rhodospirillaceae bacterium]
MTEKEKAKELYFAFDKYTYHGRVSLEENKESAKQCALIAVEEIIKVVPMYTGNLNPNWKYWEKVKDEINKYEKQ